MHRGLVSLSTIMSLLIWPCAADDTAFERPHLNINDAFVAPPWRIGVDAQGTVVSMGSPAKAVATWSLHSPLDPPRLSRVPIRDEEQQRAHAVAVSPSGETIAYSVPLLRNGRSESVPGTARIYIIETSTGLIANVIEGISTRPQDLAFSSDGSLLAASLSDGCGVRVWRTSDWQVTRSDDKGYAGGDPSASKCCTEDTPGGCDALPDTTAVIFTDAAHEQGQALLITAGATGVRFYEANGASSGPIKHLRPEDLDLERPDGLAISPDGTHLAIGDARRPAGTSGQVRLRVAVVNLRDQALARTFEVGEEDLLHPGFLDLSQNPAANQLSLNRVAWIRANGETYLVAGGAVWCQIARTDLLRGPSQDESLDQCLISWRFLPDKPAQVSSFVRVGTDRLMDLRTTRSHSILLHASQNGVGGITHEGAPAPLNPEGEVLEHRAQLFDFRDRAISNDPDNPQYLDFAISADASKVFFEGFASSPQRPARLVFDVNKLDLVRYSSLPPDARSPLHDPLQVSPSHEWKNQKVPPTLFGALTKLPSGEVERYRAVATHESGLAAVGSSNFIRIIKVEAGTAEVLCEERISAEAFRVNISTDARTVLVGQGDGSLHWYEVAKDEASEDQKSCKLVPRLIVTLRETFAGSGEWTWVAINPLSGHFAVDAAARDLVEWQMTGPTGNVERIDTRLLWQPLLRPDRLKKALSETVPLANTTSDLWRTIRKRIDPTRISVVAPKRRTAVTNERMVISLELKGPISSPRKLWIRTGEYLNTAKSFDGKHYGPDEPIMINAPGRFDLEVELPHSFRRQQGEKQICLWLDAWEKGCHTLVWAGPPAPAKPKRLHAVIVGISDYNDRKLNLGSPDSDAIDLTNLFLNDYKARVLEKRSTVEPDFATAEFDLLVATASAGKKAELNNLASHPFVQLHDANTSNFLAVLDRLVREAGDDTDHEHRYLLFFAGHGYVDIREGSNRSAFLFPTPRAASPGSRSIYDQSVYGQAIMDRLEKLSGEKIVIFDACRTPVDSNENARFDPGRLEHELAARAISATLLFGSKAGQVAREQKTFVLKQRTEEDLGNGLFTYALVKALTSPEADTSRDTFGSGRIELIEVEQFLNYFFDPLNKDSPGAQFARQLSNRPGSYLQQPSIVRPRSERAAVRVIRTLDSAPIETRSSLCSWPYLRNWSYWCQ